MSIIDSLKRVERAGDENSRATQKMFDAVHAVADLIADDITKFTWSRTFTIAGRTRTYAVVSGRYLAIQEQDDYSGNEHFVTDRNWDRTQALAFAADIADGLLDQIAEWLETRSENSLKAEAALRAVVPVIPDEAIV